MKIVVSSHGAFCDGLLESYRMIAGDNPDIHSISLTDEGIGVFSERLKDLLDRLTIDEDVLIMTDLKGGTPYNESLNYMLAHPEKVRLLSGMNLPMLIEIGLIMNIESDIDKVANDAVGIGKAGVELADAITDLADDDELDL